MIKFKRGIKERGDILTSEHMEQVRDQFKVSDDRGDTITLGSAFWPQFDFAHQAYSSKIVDVDGKAEAFNEYDFNANGSGVYGNLGAEHVLIRADGKFKTYEGSQLPKMVWTDDTGAEKVSELAADAHRVNENPVLRGMHRLAVLFHNKLIDRGMSFEETKANVIATLSVVSVNESTNITRKSFNDTINQVKYDDMFKDVAFNFGIARVPHPMMPHTVQGHPLQSEYEPNMAKLFDGSEMARVVDFGTAGSMRDMKIPRPPFDIVERTTSRHNELRLPCFSDLCRVYGAKDKVVSDIPECTIWVGALLACENFSDDPHQLHPVVARAYADGVAGTQMWGKSTGEGLWFDRFKGAPDTAAELIEFVYG